MKSKNWHLRVLVECEDIEFGKMIWNLIASMAFLMKELQSNEISLSESLKLLIRTNKNM